MKNYQSYVAKLEGLVNQAIISPPDDNWHAESQLALDGQPTTELFRLVPTEQIKNSGAYFTGRDLSFRVARLIRSELRRGAVICDPTCGVGDLLLACLRCLIKGCSPPSVAQLEHQLRGYDIHKEFVHASRLRLLLALLEVQAGWSDLAAPRIGAAHSPFPNLRVGNSLAESVLVQSADCLLLNPPFNPRTAPVDCSWGSGRVSGAAIMMEAWLKAATTGTRIVAILPDVLRSGSFYDRWRREIESLARVDSAKVVGRFGPHADIDVFVLELTKRKQAKHLSGAAPWSQPSSTQPGLKVSDLFEIHVGPIVPTRDKPSGNWQLYIQARNLLPWAIIEPITKRRYGGTIYQPPFVAIRRTSRFEDRQRAVATVIRGKRSVAVENHLLVLLPRDRKLKTCLALVESLKQEATTIWLNERIRCRHLTISAISQLPLFIPD